MQGVYCTGVVADRRCWSDIIHFGKSDDQQGISGLLCTKEQSHAIQALGTRGPVKPEPGTVCARRKSIGVKKLLDGIARALGTRNTIWWLRRLRRGHRSESIAAGIR
jgi:hypothetical protein